MTDVDYRFLADALISLCESEGRPTCYTEVRFEAKLREDARREPMLAKLICGPDDDDLLEAECLEILTRARLTRRQESVVRQRLSGRTFEQIGARAGQTKQAAQQSFLAGIKKIRRAYTVYPYNGLSDVYRAEVKRGRRSRAFGTMASG